MKLVAFVLSFSLSFVVGTPLLDRIIDGNLTTYNDFPYFASVTFDDAHICGSIIYNEDWVITAASCVAGKVPSRLKVVLGQYSLINQDACEQWVEVFSLQVFDGYSNVTKLHDIAILELSKSLNFSSDCIDYIIFDELNTSSQEGLIMGWGATYSEGAASTKLRSASVTIPRPTGNCTGFTSPQQFQSQYMICAGLVEEQSPCSYDEGGPLVQGGLAVGIYSKSSAGCQNPSVFTRLSSYYAWIFKYAGAQPTSKQTARK